ncbi:PAS domain-containing protein [Lichenibacterium ramalinae]|nr:PAS domain-containing protein [Lichenibacterium ramalinae]
MKHHVSQSLHAYWDGLRAGRTAPERADVDPAAIRHILAYTFVLEVTGARVLRRDVRFRLSGTRLNALFGRDLRGTSLDGVLEAEDGPTLDALLDGVLDDRVPLVAWTRGGPAGSDAVDLELLLLPLRHHGRTHARILGSLAAVGHPGWMGLKPTAPLSLLGFQALPAQASPVQALSDLDVSELGSSDRASPLHAPPALTDGLLQRRNRAEVFGAATSLPMAEALPPRRAPPRTARFRVVQGGRTDAAPSAF